MARYYSPNPPTNPIDTTLEGLTARLARGQAFARVGNYQEAERIAWEVRDAAWPKMAQAERMANMAQRAGWRSVVVSDLEDKWFALSEVFDAAEALRKLAEYPPVPVR